MTKTRLSTRELRPLVRTIERREDELRRKLAEERERTAEEVFPELVDGTGDAADHAFARSQLDIGNYRIDGLLAELREFAAARERLQSGIFGACVDCGELIDLARLEVAPAAARCATCQERYEYARAVRH